MTAALDRYLAEHRQFAARVRDVIAQAKWRCTATVTHRISGEQGRCPVVGSEMLVAVDEHGRWVCRCPRHAEGLERPQPPRPPAQP